MNCAWVRCPESSCSPGDYCAEHAAMVNANTRALARVGQVIDAEFEDVPEALAARDVLEGEFVDPPPFAEPPHGLAYLIYQGHAYLMTPKRFELIADQGHERDDPSKPVTFYRLRFLGQARRVATL